MTKRIGVKYIGPVFDPSGYAEANRNCIAALHKAGVDVTVKVVSWDKARTDYGKTGEIVKSLVDRSIPYQFVIMHVGMEHCKKFHEQLKYNISFPYWETSKTPELWIQNTPFMQEIWASCKWNAETYKRDGIKIPITVMPTPLDISEYDPKIEPLKIDGLGPDAYKFYAIGQWTERKNFLGLLKAYYAAFTSNDKVVLIIKSYRSNDSQSEQNIIKSEIQRMKIDMNMQNYPPVYFIGNILPKEDMIRLNALGDCFVLPTRAEGFGMPYAEAMLMGKPCIATNYSSHLDFMNESNSYLIDCHEVPVAHMPWCGLYNGNQNWAQPHTLHCRDLMRHVYENREEAIKKGEKARKDMLANYNFTTVGQLMKNRLEAINVG